MALAKWIGDLVSKNRCAILWAEGKKRTHNNNPSSDVAADLSQYVLKPYHDNGHDE